MHRRGWFPEIPSPAAAAAGRRSSAGEGPRSWRLTQTAWVPAGVQGNPNSGLDVADWGAAANAISRALHWLQTWGSSPAGKHAPNAHSSPACPPDSVLQSTVSAPAPLHYQTCSAPNKLRLSAAQPAQRGAPRRASSRQQHATGRRGHNRCQRSCRWSCRRLCRRCRHGAAAAATADGRALGGWPFQAVGQFQVRELHGFFFPTHCGNVGSVAAAGGLAFAASSLGSVLCSVCRPVRPDGVHQRTLPTLPIRARRYPQDVCGRRRGGRSGPNRHRTP